MKRKYLSIPLFVLMLSTVLSIPLHLMPASALPLAGPSLVVDDSINRVNATLGINSGSQITAKGTIKNIGGVTLTNLLTGAFFIEGTGVLVPADFSFEYSPDGITWFPIHPSEVKVPTPAAAPMQVELVVGSPGGETLAPNATQTMYLRMTLNNNVSPISWPTNIIQSMIVWVYGDTNLNRQYDGGEIIYSQPPAYGGLVGWDNPVKIDLAIVHTAEIAGTGRFYYSIQSAIDAATPGQTIYVYSGMYALAADSPIRVNKAITLTGDITNPSNVVIKAPPSGAWSGRASGFVVSASNVVIQGFHIQDALDLSPVGPTTKQNKGIWIGHTGDTEIAGIHDVAIAHNEITNCGDGIMSAYAYNIDILYNDIWSNIITNYYSYSGGKGIVVYGNSAGAAMPRNILIDHNRVHNNELWGIQLNVWNAPAPDNFWFNINTTISNNIIYNNGGPFDHYGTGTNYDSGFGIISNGHTTGVIVKNNEIYGHTTGTGSRLKSTTSAIRAIADKGWIIGNNAIHDNFRGIYLYGFGYGLPDETTLHVVDYNEVYSNAEGISVGKSDAGYAHYNNIHDNKNTTYMIDGYGPYGIRNLDLVGTFDARFNWWGSATGPTHASNLGGIGDNITNNVDYSPWLGKTVGSTPMTWHVNPTGTIQETVDEAKSGDTILVHSGTYIGALYITKSLTIQAASTPVIQGSQLFATNYGSREAVIFVEDAQNVILNGLDIEGLGLGPVKSYAVLYENSSGMVYNCTVSPNTIGDMNSAAIAAWDNSVVTIAGCTIKNFGRIGVYSNNATMSIVGNTIIGQVYAADNLVNYGIEIEDYSGPSIATITQNVIYNCNNTHPNPMWSSAAIIVDTWREWADVYGLTLLPSRVSITYNMIYDNYESIEIVSNEFSYAHCNNFTNNAWGVWSAPENWTTNPTYHVFDARFNWWGDTSGPHHTTSWMYNGNPYGPHFGSGDEVSDYVLYDPWTGLPLPTINAEPPLIEKQMVNTTFAVNITISNLSGGYRAVGFQFRLLYDSELIEAINVTEGPFLKDPTWNPEGTIFISIIEVDPVYGPCVLVGILVLPNDTGSWEVFPVGNGTLATITFRTLKQETGLEKLPLTCDLTLVTTQIINDDLEEIQHNTNNGLYKMYPTNAADINRDYKVDMKDIGIAARAFGTVPGDERWNPLADITGPITWVPDGKVDMRDIGVIARNFGWRPLDDP